MTGWLEGIVGPDYAAALMWTITALIVLLVLLILVRIVRGFGVGTFVAGGRNRKARLAVMDATAVDSHRRLVLVRRDDVEHLILIGGPTDVVVEQNIRLIAPTRRVADENDQPRRAPAQEAVLEQPRAQPQPQMQPASRPAPPAPPRQAPVVPAPVAPAPASPQPQRFQTEPRAPQVAQAHAPASFPDAPASQTIRRVETPIVPAPAPLPHAIASSSPQSKIDDALLQELELSLDSQPTAAAPVAAKSEPDKTLDEEMSRLLNDLAGQR